MAPVIANIVLPGSDSIGKGQERVADFWSQVAVGEVHPLRAAVQPSQEALRSSDSAPVVVTANPMVEQQVLNGSDDPAQPLPINGSTIAINTQTFEGFMEIHLKGLPNTKVKVFQGKKRFFQIMVQGRFKRPVNADGLCMGQEFLNPPANLNPWMAEMLLTAAAKIFSSTTKVGIRSPSSYFMNPILAACQVMNVSEKGKEPSLWEATEDMRLFCSELADKKGKPVSSDTRRKWCDVPRNLAGKQFSPDHVYTFHIWQHFIDFSTYRGSLGGLLNLDLTPFLNCEPLQLTCKDTSADEYMFSMLVWHEKLLYPDTNSSSVSGLVEKLGKLWVW